MSGTQANAEHERSSNPHVGEGEAGHATKVIEHARKMSDVLLTVRPMGGSEMFTRIKTGDYEEYYADPAFCGEIIERMRSDLREAKSALRPPRTEIAGWPKEVPADVIAAVVGGGVTVDQVRNIYGLLRAAFNLREPKLPQDVVTLVIAAREIMDDDASPESRQNLDTAAEAFASRVPWEDAPLPAPPVSEEGR